MGTISSRSPAMAYSNGGLWVSTFDESGRRCWVNNLTGERTYRFINGIPANPMADLMVSPPCPTMQSPAPWGYNMPNPVQAPVYGGGVSMVPVAGSGIPPVTPAGNGGLMHRMQKYYIRPSSDSSWMWR